MKRKARFAAAVAVCESLFLATAAGADPLAIYDENMTAVWILQTCKTDPSEVYKKYPTPEPKLRAMGDAAWHQLWDGLDKEDGAHHDENARKADFELKKRADADFAHAEALAKSQGCDALVPHAREMLEHSMQ